MKLIVFDLGDTLIEYKGIPLSWETHYEKALRTLATALNLSVRPDEIARACAVLQRYNTRRHPRTEEVSFATVLANILTCFGVTHSENELACARVFFALFRQRLRCFPDAPLALTKLRASGAKLAVFSDVPYGMPRELVIEDIRDAGLENAFDVIATSRDAGFRKPAPGTLQFIADQFGCHPSDMTHVGNEKKDVDVARAFGCRAILIDRTGHGPNWGQDSTIASMSEL